MKPAWTVVAYVRSLMGTKTGVASVMSLTIVIFGVKPPTNELVEAAVNCHTRNCELIISEVEYTPFDDDFFSTN